MSEQDKEFIVPGLDNDDLIDLLPSSFPPYAAVLERAAARAKDFDVVVGDEVRVRARWLHPHYFFPVFSDRRYRSYITIEERSEVLRGKVMRISRLALDRIMVLDLSNNPDDPVACSMSLDALFETGDIEKVQSEQES